MKVWMRVLYFAMALLMVMTAAPAAAAAGQTSAEEPAAETTPEDIVLLLDCSMSLLSNDPKNLCLEACEIFLSNLPTQDARITVIAFGYEGAGYTYTSRFEVEYQQDARMINMIVPFGDLSSTEVTDGYKAVMSDAVMSNRHNTNTWTPIGHALAAAVDALEENGSADGKACIILVSDGVRESRTKYQDERLLEPASKTAGEHQWPIYCVELNYNNNNAQEVQAAQTLMDSICKNSGDRLVSRLSCKDPKDVHIAFKKIFVDFYNLYPVDPSVNPEDYLDKLVAEIKLPGEHEFEIPYLTSEATVDVVGESIEYLELVNMDQNTSTKISDNMETENLIAVKGNNSYAIKMICPEPGKWKVVMHGDANATVLVSNINLREMGLKMRAVPTSNADILLKTDEVKVDAFFAYRDTELHNSTFYTDDEYKDKATLKVFCSNGDVKEYPMEASTSGYSYQLKVGDLPVGSFEVMVEMRHTMFRNGKQSSNSATFKTQNLPLELVKTEPVTIDAFVNGKAERLDLATIFHNPDKDPVTYTFGCTSDRTKEFENVLDAEQNYLDIAPGLVPGTYALEVTAKDPDMKEALVYTFDLVVTNRAPVYSSEENPVVVEDLWIDNWSLQEIGAVSAQLDLNDYFSDPDGMPLTYQVKAADGEEGPLVNLEQNEGDLTILPELEGTATITVVASDGLDQIEASFDVTVLSAKHVYWKENGFWWILGIIIFLVIVMVCITMYATTKVRGKWSISVTVNGQTASCGPIALTTCGKACKKRKFTLLELIRGAKKYLTTGNPAVVANITDYFTENNRAERITLHGVATGSGFKLSGVPKNDQISVTHDGRSVIKGAIRSGNVQFTLRKTSNTGVSEAVIVLNCVGKSKKHH